MKSSSILVLLSTAMLGTLLTNCAQTPARARTTVASGPSVGSPDWYYRDPATGYTPILERNVGFKQFQAPSATPVMGPAAARKN